MSNENARKDTAHVSAPANPQDCSGAVGEEHLDKVTGGSEAELMAARLLATRLS
jgi:hypothetical protein